jgi:glutamine amidotransferase
MIVIVDSGGANLASICSAISRLGGEVLVTACKNELAQASHVILPGVGSAETVMNRLNKLGLVDVLKAFKKPVLGICVGMQILFEFSDEGATSCLGILPGTIKKFPRVTNLSLPHMGWNTVDICKPSSLFKNIPQQAYLYFVHSFAAAISRHTLAKTQHGIPFSAAVQSRNFTGVQFHPERSGPMGQQILKNFLEQSDDYISGN